MTTNLTRERNRYRRALFAIVNWRRLQVLSRGETPAAIARKALGLPVETIENNKVHGKL